MSRAIIDTDYEAVTRAFMRTFVRRDVLDRYSTAALECGGCVRAVVSRIFLHRRHGRARTGECSGTLCDGRPFHGGPRCARGDAPRFATHHGLRIAQHRRAHGARWRTPEPQPFVACGL